MPVHYIQSTHLVVTTLQRVNGYICLFHYLLKYAFSSHNATKGKWLYMSVHYLLKYAVSSYKSTKGKWLYISVDYIQSTHLVVTTLQRVNGCICLFTIY